MRQNYCFWFKFDVKYSLYFFVKLLHLNSTHICSSARVLFNKQTVELTFSPRKSVTVGISLAPYLLTALGRRSKFAYKFRRKILVLHKKYRNYFTSNVNPKKYFFVIRIPRQFFEIPC